MNQAFVPGMIRPLHAPGVWVKNIKPCCRVPVYPRVRRGWQANGQCAMLPLTRPPAQHSLCKQPRGPRCKHARLEPHTTWHRERSTKTEFEGKWWWTLKHSVPTQPWTTPHVSDGINILQNKCLTENPHLPDKIRGIYGNELMNSTDCLWYISVFQSFSAYDQPFLTIFVDTALKQQPKIEI